MLPVLDEADATRAPGRRRTRTRGGRRRGGWPPGSSQDGAVGDVVGVTHLHDKPLPPIAGTPFDDVPHMLDQRLPGALAGHHPLLARGPASGRRPGPRPPDAGAAGRRAEPVVGHRAGGHGRGCRRPASGWSATCARPRPAARSGSTAPRHAAGQPARPRPPRARRRRQHRGRCRCRARGSSTGSPGRWGSSCARSRRGGSPTTPLRHNLASLRLVRAATCLGRGGRRDGGPGRAAAEPGASDDRHRRRARRPGDGPGLRARLAELEPDPGPRDPRDVRAPRARLAAHHALQAGHRRSPPTASRRKGCCWWTRAPGSRCGCTARATPRSTYPRCAPGSPGTGWSWRPMRRTRCRCPRRADLGRGLAGVGDSIGRQMGVVLATPPTVWCSWYHYFLDVTEADIVENLDAFARHDLPSTSCRSTTAGRRASGTGSTSPRGSPRSAHWPTGSATPGAAPGSGSRRSSPPSTAVLAAEHPDWLHGDAGTNWGGALHGLDLTRDDVRDYLRESFARLRESGYDYFKLDFLYGGALPGPRARDVTSVQAYRSGLELIREAVGPDAYLLGCGAPILPSVGLVDGMRVVPGHLSPRRSRGRHDDAAWSSGGRGAGLAAGTPVGQRRRLRGGPAGVPAPRGVARRGRPVERAAILLRPGRRPRRLGPGRRTTPARDAVPAPCRSPTCPTPTGGDACPPSSSSPSQAGWSSSSARRWTCPLVTSGCGPGGRASRPAPSSPPSEAPTPT